MWLANLRLRREAGRRAMLLARCAVRSGHAYFAGMLSTLGIEVVNGTASFGNAPPAEDAFGAVVPNLHVDDQAGAYDKPIDASVTLEWRAVWPRAIERSEIVDDGLGRARNDIGALHFLFHPGITGRIERRASQSTKKPMMTAIAADFRRRSDRHGSAAEGCTMAGAACNAGRLVLHAVALTVPVKK